MQESFQDPCTQDTLRCRQRGFWQRGFRQRRFGQTGVQLEQRRLAGKNSGEACQDNALGLDTANVNHSDTNVGPRNA